MQKLILLTKLGIFNTILQGGFMPILLYNGSSRQIGIRQKPFLQRVPTWAFKNEYEEIKKRIDFEEYIPKKSKINEVSKPTIFVKLDNSLYEFLAAFKAIHKLTEMYPTCNFAALATGIRATLLSVIPRLQSIREEDTRLNAYYRTFKLNKENGSAKKWLSPITLRNLSLEDSFLGMIEQIKQDELEKESYLIQLPKTTSEKYVLVLKNGKDTGSTYKGLGDYLAANWKDKFTIKTTEVASLHNLDRDTLNLINNASYIVSAGESELSFLAGYLRIPTFIFIPENIYTVGVERTYEIFPNLQLSSIDSSDLATLKSKADNLLEIVRKGIGKESKPASKPASQAATKENNAKNEEKKEG